MTHEDQTGPAGTEAVAATAPIATPGWTTPPTDGTGSRSSSRLALGLAWIIAAAVALVSAWISYGTSEGSEAFRTGRALGSAVAPILLALGLRWLYLRTLGRRSGGVVLHSAWVPLGALVISLIIAMRAVTAFAQVVAVDPETALRIAPPYTLVDAEPAVVDAVRSQDVSSTGAAVRQIDEGGELRGWLVASNAGLRAADWEDFARGFELEARGTSTRTVVQGQDVAVATTADGAMAAWIEPPLMIMVIALDTESATELARAVISDR